MVDAASRLTHLLDRQFFSHFRSHFPQNKPWRLLPLPSDYKRQLTTILINKQSPRVSQPPSSIKTPPPGANGVGETAAFTNTGAHYQCSPETDHDFLRDSPLI